MNSIYYPTESTCTSGSISPQPADDDELTVDDGRQGKLSRGQSRIEFERLAQFFHVPINEAAKGLGVCATVLKKVCRKYGIPRWPHRKIKKLDTLLSMLETSAAKNTTNNPHHDDDVRRKIETVTRDRMILLTEGKLEETRGNSKSRVAVAGQKRSKSAHDIKLKGRDRKKRRVDLRSSMDDVSGGEMQASSPEDGSATSSGYASPTPPSEYEFGAIEFASVEFSPPEFASADYPSTDYSSQGFAVNPYISSAAFGTLPMLPATSSNLCVPTSEAAVHPYMASMVSNFVPQDTVSYSAPSSFMGPSSFYDYPSTPVAPDRDVPLLAYTPPMWEDDGSTISSTPSGSASPICYSVYEQGQIFDNSPFLRFFSAVDMSLMQGAM